MTDGRSAFAEVFSHYRELLRKEPWLETAVCWTVVVPHDRPFSAADFGARVSGGTPHEVHEAAPLEALPYYEGGHPMSVAPAGPAVVLFENNGFLGSLPEVLRRLSRDGRVCGVYWNVEGDNRLSYAADGRVLVNLDAMFWDEWTGDDVAVLEPELRAMTDLLAGDEDDWQAAAMTALRLVCGVVDRAAERDRVADGTRNGGAKRRVGAQAERVVDRRERHAERHEHGDREDLRIVESGVAQLLNIRRGGAVGVARHLPGPRRHGPLAVAQAVVDPPQHPRGGPRVARLGQPASPHE
ncbi:DUF6461 domain-containing protein [Microbispora bryophytorum]|uniref:DUF6461 domain-containing protein n=1 Tax=Microbispora bryophytorum TaxID=1460882 RepID=UPI00340658E1